MATWNPFTVCIDILCVLVVLYQYSRPRRLSPNIEQLFGMRRSKLSAIIQTFSTAFVSCIFAILIKSVDMAPMNAIFC